MFERFTDRCRKVLALANQETQRLNHEYIGTEHILLGLIEEDCGTGAKVLKDLGVDAGTVRLQIEKLVKAGDKPITHGKRPQTPRAKKVIEYAIEEARAMNDRFIGTEHLLLGLIREHDAIAAQVLRDLGLNLESVRRKVYEVFEEEERIDESQRRCSDTQIARIQASKRPFTARAEKAMRLACQEAVRRSHQCVSTQHLVLALAKEGQGKASRIFSNHKINSKLLQREVAKLLRPGSSLVPMGQLPLTPVMRRVVAYAADEAESLGHPEVGTDHLLLALMWDSETVIAHLLADLGLKLDEVRDEACRLHREDYRDLLVWRKADEFALRVYLTTASFPKEEARGIAAQLRRGALAIPLVLMEASGARYEQRFTWSVREASSALARLRHLLRLSHQLKYLDDQEHSSICEQIDTVDRLLRDLQGGVSSEEPNSN